MAYKVKTILCIEDVSVTYFNIIENDCEVRFFFFFFFFLLQSCLYLHLIS